MNNLTPFIVGYWIVAISAFLMGSVYFFVLGYQAKAKKERRRIMSLISLMFMFLALSRMFHLIAIVNHGILENVGYGNLSLENELLFTISQIWFYASLIMIIASFERKLELTKHNFYTMLCLFITIYYFIVRYLYVFNKQDQLIHTIEIISSYIMNLIFGIFGVALSLMYLKITISASGDVKRKALMIFIGFVVLILSYVIFILEDFLPDIEIVATASFTFCVISVPFLIYGYR